MMRKHDPHSEADRPPCRGTLGHRGGACAGGGHVQHCPAQRLHRARRQAHWTLYGAQNTFEFVPQFKITFVGNNQPRITNVDDAMRRRLVLVPFTQKPATADITLKDRLVDEYPGILRWMIEGETLRRTMGGLTALVPTAAVTATNAYLDEQNTLKKWGEEELIFSPGEQVGVMKALEAYKTWCYRQGEPTGITKQDFNRKFVETFPLCPVSVRPKTGVAYKGVGFSQQDV